MRMLRIILSRINKMWLLMGAAVILGLVATWVTTQYLKTREARIEAEAKKRAIGGTTVSVVVPTRKLKKGDVVDSGTMAARDVLAETVYDETVLAADFGKVQGSRLLRPVEEGRPLRLSDLDIHVKEFSETLPEGKRAITVEIDELNSIAQILSQQMGRFRATLRSDEDEVIKPLAKVTTKSVMRGYPEVAAGGEAEVEFIIGGKGSGGVGQAQTVNVNMPGMAGLMGAGMPGASSPPPPPAGAISGAPGQVTVPGVGSFAYPTTSATTSKP
jgi:hypothetical protein